MREALPELEKISYDEFAIAAEALVQMDLVEDLPNPLAKQAVAFVFEGTGQPQACQELCAAALHARIGTKSPNQAKPESLAAEDVGVVFKHIKAFLPKAGQQPDWWAPWKASVEKDAKEKEEIAKKKKGGKGDPARRTRKKDAGGKKASAP